MIKTITRVPYLIDKNNTIWTFYTSGINLCCRYSDDYGDSWSSEEIIGSDIGYDKVLTDVDNNNYIHLIYRRYTGGYYQIFYRVKTGSGWSSEVQITSGSNNYQLNYSDTISSYGNRVCFTYGKDIGTNDRDIYFAEKIGAGAWTNTEIVNDGNANWVYNICYDSNYDVILLYSNSSTLSGANTRYKQRVSSVWSAAGTIDTPTYFWLEYDILHTFSILRVGEYFYLYGYIWNYPGDETYDIVEYKKRISDGAWVKTIIKTDTRITNIGATYFNGKFVVFYDKYIGTSSYEGWRGIKNGSWVFNKIKDADHRQITKITWNYYANNGEFVTFGSGVNNFWTNRAILNISESGVLSDELLKRAHIYIEETGVLSDEISVPFFDKEGITVQDSIHITKKFYETEGIEITDSVNYYQIIHPTKEEILISDSVETSFNCPYVRWILNEPLNNNFSFEDFTYGYVLENVTAEEYKESYRYHCLDLIFTNNGCFSKIIDVTSLTKYKIWANFYKVSNNFTIKIYSYPSLELIKSFDSTISNDGWNYYNDFFTSKSDSQIIIKIESDNAQIYLDNLAIVEDSYIRNPAELTIPYIAQQLSENTLNDINIVPILNYNEIYNISLMWELVNYTEKKYLESLRNKKILIRTHDMKAFAVEVDGVRIEMPPKYEGKNQKYTVTINLKVY